MPRNSNGEETCPICGVKTEVDQRAWFFTCSGCGSGINLIGIWWKNKTGEDWSRLSDEKKLEISDQFYSTRKDWKNEILEI
ncbi:MAG: hypothetical protein PVJ38_04115 [Candidatus Bathyarchaeota archaeon]|jgi:transcription initiation factor TFIIIB Brf1 subunit/transcription initiation factor TFIIB